MENRDGPTTSARAWRFWTAIAMLGIVFVGASSFYLVASLHHEADESRQELAVFSQLEADANYESALEWQAIAAGRLEPGLEREMEKVERTIADKVARLLGNGDTETGTEAEIAGALESYQRVLTAEFSLLRAGKLEQALAVDREQVDPRFERLHALLGSAGDEHEAAAGRARRKADIGSALTVALASLLAGLLFWKLHRVRRSAAEATARESALQESETRFRSLVENSSDMITLVERDTTIRYQSDSSLRVIGYPAAELLGKRLVELVHPDDLHHLLSVYDDPGSGAGIEYRVRHPEGGWVHLESLATPLEGNWAGGSLVLNTRDLTDRKAAEQRRAAGHDVTRVLAESATLAEATPRILEVVCTTLGWEAGGLWVLDRDEKVLRCTDTWQAPSAAASAFAASSRGMSIAHGVGLPGRVWAQREPLWVPDLTRLTDFPRADLAAATDLHAAFAVPIVLGAEFLGVLDFFSREIREPDEDLLDMMAAIGSQIGQFIERKESEQAVRRSEARKRAILDSALDCVITIDHEGKIVEFNPAAEQTFGYDRTTVIGEPMAELIIPPSLREAHYRGLERCLETGGGRVLNRRVELPAMRADRSEFVAELTVTKVGLSDPPLFTAYLRDISERRAAEQALVEGEEKFRTLVSNLPGAVFRCRLDSEWTEILLSDAIEKISGYPASDFIENHVRAFASIIHRSDIDRVEQDVRAAVDASRAYSVEYRILHADGSVRWVWERGQAVKGPEEQVLWLDGVLFDVTERKAIEAALERQGELNRHQALHDALTGLPNRTLFRDRIEQAIRTSERQRGELAVLIMDLDRFKEVNDTLGHHSGDLLLQELGRRLRLAMRESDTICRLGGDEFGLLLPTQSGAADLPGVIERIRNAVEEPFVVQGLPLGIEASVGVALYPRHGQGVDVLLQRADVAMYTAKESNDLYAVYDAERDEYDPARLKLVGELRRALDAGELALHYQPKADLRTGQVTSVEALLRWHHPERGIITPGEFIPVAEQTGLIKPLTLFALEAALRQCRDWQRSGSPLEVAVNLSARNLLDSELPGDISALLEKWEVQPAGLVLEMTESSIVSDPFRARVILERLKEIGLRLSVDDFGTGFSSLAHLKRLPVDEIKIDRSFVMGITTDKDDAAIVRSVIELGRNLGLTVVAEGVETREIYEKLVTFGCDLVQGYYLSPPVPADRLVEWLSEAGSTRPPKRARLASRR